MLSVSPYRTHLLVYNYVHTYIAPNDHQSSVGERYNNIMKVFAQNIFASKSLAFISFSCHHTDIVLNLLGVYFCWL